MVICQQHTSAGTGNDLIPVEADGIIRPEGSRLVTFVDSAQRFRRILYEDSAIFPAYCC